MCLDLSSAFPLALCFAHCPEGHAGSQVQRARGLPGQQQVAAEDPEQGSGPPSVEVQGGEGASSLGHQDQVGPAEAWLRSADGLELPQAHREGPGAPGAAGLGTWGKQWLLVQYEWKGQLSHSTVLSTAQSSEALVEAALHL